MSKRWPYLPAVREVRVGTVLEADDSFTCLTEGARRVVKRDRGKLPMCVPHGAGGPDLTINAPRNSRARLYICCAKGRHYLDGQECRAGEHGIKTPHYVGLKIVRRS